MSDMAHQNSKEYLFYIFDSNIVEKMVQMPHFCRQNIVIVIGLVGWAGSIADVDRHYYWDMEEEEEAVVVNMVDMDTDYKEP